MRKTPRDSDRSFRKVLILQTVMKQYNAPLFEGLYQSLLPEGVQLSVAYGEPSEKESSKADCVQLDPKFGTRVRNRWFFKEKVVYQPVLEKIRGADLVVVEQANKHLVNYLLLLLSQAKLKKVAYWGHGRNFQASPNTLEEKWKRWLLNRSDTFFAYTQKTVRYLESCGVPKEKIFNLNNAFDARTFQKQMDQVSDAEVAALKRKMGIPPHAFTGLYVGALYPGKKIDFLVETIQKLRAKKECPFHLVIAGSGPQRAWVEDVAGHFEFIHYAGAKFGKEKAELYRVADLVLNPGLTGLGILDAFAAGVPYFTTENSGHGPEIEYLENGKNGVQTEFDLDAFVDQVEKLLEDSVRREEMGRYARSCADRYSLENMIENFKTGVLNSISST